MVNGYEALAEASSPSKFTVSLDLPPRAIDMVPAVAGAALGIIAWPAHRVLGGLNGAALAHNIYALVRGTTTKKEAIRSLSSHALATMGALTVRNYPVLGYLGGALAGGMVARILGVEDGFSILGEDAPSANAIYTDHDTVLAVQTALRAKGFDPGPLDGEIGPRTQAAIKRMQGALGADQSGIIDYGVLAALQVTPSKQAQVAQKNLASDLPTDGRPAKGWSQPGAALVAPTGASATTSIEKRPAWQSAALGAGAVAGVVALIAGLVALVKR